MENKANKKSVKIIITALIIFAVAAACILLIVLKNHFLPNTNGIYANAGRIYYEYKYNRNPSMADKLNYYYFLSYFESEESIKVIKDILPDVTEEDILKSKFKSSFGDLLGEEYGLTPQEVMTYALLFDELRLGQYETYIDEFSACYKEADMDFQLYLDSTALSIYSIYRETECIDSTIAAYSKIAFETDDNMLKLQCLAKIPQLRDAVFDAYGKTVSIDNEMLRGMAFDGEYIEVPVNDSGHMKYYNISTGEMTDSYPPAEKAA